MTERTVVTRLRAEVAQYKREMASAAATTAMAMAIIDKSSRNASGGMLVLERDSQKAGNALDSVSGRAGLAAHAIAMLGPAGATAGAVGAAGLGLLLTQVTGLLAAGGVLVAVFQGFGDALKAVNKAHLEPTAENLAAAREEMAKLHPETQKAVLAIQGIRPALREIRDAGAGQFFPGFVEGVEQAATRAEDLERITAALGGALGDLTADAGSGLASDDWDDFFDYLATDATTTVTDFGHTLGNLSRGVAELVMAFDPLSDGLSESMVSGSKGFAEWADQLSDTAGFQEFVQYVQQNGPQLGETLVAVGNAFLQIGEAAAPLGGPVLSILEAVADVVASIADSDFGAPIMAGVAALSLLNRTLAMTGKLSGSAAISGAAGGGGLFGGMIAARSGINGLASDLKVLRRDVVAIGPATQQVAAATGRMKDRLAAAGKAGAGVAAVGLVASGAADQIGAANTATMALTGAMMGGPLGAAAGAAVGAFMDIKGGADGLRDSIEAMNAAATSGDLGQMVSSLKQAKGQLKDTQYQLPWEDGFQGKDLLAGGALGGLDMAKAGWAKFSGAEGAAKKAIAEQERLIDAQEEIERTAQEAADAQNGLGYSLEAVAARVKLNADAQREATQAMLGTRSAVRDYEAALDAAAEALARNGRTLDITTAAGRENQAALDGIAATWDRVNGTAEGTPSRFMKVRKGVIDAAMAFGQTRKEAEATARQLVSIPENVSVELLAKGIDPAKASAQQLKAAIDRLHDKEIEISMITRQTTIIAQVHAKRTDPGLTNHAEGGYIQGPGTGTSDDIPAMLSNGEYVIPAARVTQYGLGLMESLRTGSYELERQHFAKGGQAGKGKKAKKKLTAQEKRDIRAAEEFLREDEYAAKIVKSARKTGRKAKSPGVAENSEFNLMAKPMIKAWEKDNAAVIKQTKATEVQTSKLQDLISSQDDLKSSIMEAYQSDLFGGTDDGWSKPSKGPMGILDEDIRNINALGKAESRLDDVLKGDALAAVLKGPLADAQAMASWSNQQLAAYQAKFDQRTALAGGVAANAGQSAYGPMIAAQERATLAAERRELKMEKRLGRFEQRVDAWPAKFADALSKTARNAKGKGKS